MGGRSKIKAEYSSSLADLTFNSKPLISVLTILAGENVAYAKDIVQIIENHLSQVRTDVKLPVLYLIDCIIKKVGAPYRALFSQNIVSTFCGVFKEVDEKTRADMFRLRQTWNNVTPPNQLYALDVQLTRIDPAWPVGPIPPSVAPIKSELVCSDALDQKTHSMQQKIIDKQRELLELQQRKLQLEVLQAQVELQERLQNQTMGQIPSVPTSQLQNSPTSADPQIPSRDPRISIRDPRLLRRLEQNSSPPADIRYNVHLDSKILIENKGNFEPPCEPKALSHSSPPKHAQKIAAVPKNGRKPCRSSRSSSNGSESSELASLGSLTKVKKYSRLPGVTIRKKTAALGSDEGAGATLPSGEAASGLVKKRCKGGDDNKLLPKSVDCLNQEVDYCRGGSTRKQPGIQDGPKNTLNQSKDVVKQQLAPIIPRRKRLSNEPRKSPKAKKSKSDTLDILFGKEDIDLRQSPPLQPPPEAVPRTPSPPQPTTPLQVHSPEAKNKKELREAKESDGLGDISLQTISDDELEADFTEPMDTSQNKVNQIKIELKKEEVPPKAPLRQIEPLMGNHQHHGGSRRRNKPRRQRWGDQIDRSHPKLEPEIHTVPKSVPQPTVDINELFQRLVASGMVAPAPAAPAKGPPSPDFTRPETLKIRRPFMVRSLYRGMQCGSCGMRFAPEQDGLYGQHLDWHFRQNHKKNIRKAFSRLWYYSHSDWIKYEEVEDLGEKEKCFFESQQLEQGSDEEVEIACVSADCNVQDAACEVCWEKFDQFFSEEKDEWQLRLAKRVDGKTYHPLCYEDYQASLTDRSLDDSRLSAVHNSGNPADRIPLLNTLKETPHKEDALKDEALTKEEDDDVIINEVVPEQIVIDDEDDMNDHTSSQRLISTAVVKEQPTNDEFINTNSPQQIKIKTEPADYDEAEFREINSVEEDTTLVDVVSSIDGNVELDVGVPASVGGKIKINFTKPLPVVVRKDLRDLLVSEQLSRVDEEPVQVALKAALKGVDLKRQPTVKKGAELSGLCSIM